MRANSTSELRLPPGPEERLAFAQNGLIPSPLTVLSDLVERYGEVVRFSTRYNTSTLVNNPAYARQILGSHDFVRGALLRTILGNGLLAADGPHWERQRRTMLPEFRPAKVESLVDSFREITLEHIQNLLAVDETDPKNLTRIMERIALSNIASGLFGSDISDSFLDAFGLVVRDLGALGNATNFGMPLVRTPESNRNFSAAMQAIESSVDEILDAESNSRGLLHCLKSHQTESGAPLTRRELRDEIVTMITAGHETTAVSLGWIWHVLMSQSAVCDNFYQEIDRVLNGRPITAQDVPKLTFTRQLIDETFRLYPPVWAIGRTALRDATVGEYHIPANSLVVISPFLLHRHPGYWTEPERFDPTRFADEAAHDDGSYIPFLSGRHLCIGKHFALTEIVVVLATIAQRFRFRRANSEPVVFAPSIALRMQSPLRAFALPRQGELVQ
ncbi:MAG: cytochrome P450 [Planctomycetota bacterium]|nr:cytochrome P450 [Planctomycetota bacterium]